MIQESQKENIVRAMELYISDHNLSNNKFAKQVQVSPSYISAMVNRRWNEMPAGNKLVKIEDRYFERIAEAIGLQLKESDWGHFETDNYAMITDVLNESRMYQTVMAIDGETGLGKTYAIQDYRRKNPNETYVIECAGDFTAKRFIVELCKVLNLSHIGTTTDLRLSIVRKLSNDNNPLLIIDEAENLKDNTWHSIKKVMDDVASSTNRKAGIVLFGANNFEEKMQRRAERMKEPFPQVHSRIKEGGYYNLFTMNYDDKKNILDQLGISSLKVKKVLDTRCNNMRELYGAVTKLRREEKITRKPVDELIDIIR